MILKNSSNNAVFFRRPSGACGFVGKCVRDVVVSKEMNPVGLTETVFQPTRSSPDMIWVVVNKRIKVVPNEHGDVGTNAGDCSLDFMQVRRLMDVSKGQNTACRRTSGRDCL